MAEKTPKKEPLVTKTPSRPKRDSLKDLKSLSTETDGSSPADAAQPGSGEERGPRVQKLDKQGRAYATGRRKNAVARVWLKPGRATSWSTTATKACTSRGRRSASC